MGEDTRDVAACPDCENGYRVVPMSKRDPLLGVWFVPCRTCAPREATASPAPASRPTGEEQ